MVTLSSAPRPRAAPADPQAPRNPSARRPLPPEPTRWSSPRVRTRRMATGPRALAAPVREHSRARAKTRGCARGDQTARAARRRGARDADGPRLGGPLADPDPRAKDLNPLAGT